MTKLSKIEELALIAKCALNEDRDAFGVLVECYQRELRSFLLRLTMGDYALTDDLSQETFIKAYVNIRQFRGLSRFKTWLYRIAYNEFYEHMRRTEREVITDTLPETGATNSHNSTETAIDIATAMKSLSPQERAVVTLYFIKDLPIKEVSRITAMPEGTVKSHISRAKAKMAQVLKPDTTKR